MQTYPAYGASGRDTGPQYRIHEIDGFLETLEDVASSEVLITKGPFSVFSTSSNHREQLAGSNSDSTGCEVSPSGLANDNIPNAETSPVQAAFDDTQAASTLESLSTPINTDPQQQDADGAVDVVPEPTDAHEFPPAILQEVLGASLETSNHNTWSNSTDNSIVLSHMGTPLRYAITTSISGDAVIDRLMHHYAEHVAVMLQPIQHPQNPYRQLYVPAALEAASGLTSPAQRQLHIPKAAVKSVIFHSLVASSAFHLWNCLPSQIKYHKIGARHRQQALLLLRSAISLEMPTAEYKTLMVAMLSLVTIDFMSGCEADFAVHLQGTTQLRKRRRKWRMISRATQQLNEISDFLCLLARTMTFSSSPGPWSTNPAEDVDQFAASQRSSNCCYGYMYGITPLIAAELKETCRLAEYLTWYERSREPIPDSLLEACEALGDRLCSWNLKRDGAHEAISQDQDGLEIFRHHANAWHLATVIYYHRRIQKCRSEDQDEIVARIAEHMHAVEDIKDRSTSSCATQRMAPIMWPAFVASCDAIERRPWALWWQRAQCYHIANYERQWEVVQTMWQKKDEMDQTALGVFDWIETFKGMGITLFPI
ncbi:hypothetical protein CGLO_17943 [Colletotrichum gloeosporioides Cg-14]|uniref:Fungal-specific transcription factor domain-containing protein n=1 Tax=Colletotrichum gloeosporioides (strain Cg-14) TaxID=1237896 RepID=T0L5A1_COLGC|nr:hypothetical protein CGLO_17943 [Colletotrichum gloeosporioides Cg-14]